MTVSPVEDPSEEDLARWQRTMAPLAYNHTWSLLDRTDLSTAEEDDMLASTFAQRWHWYRVGTARNKAIADWQVARVAAVLGYADLARRFGQRALEAGEAHDLGAFIRGFAHEAIARAAAYVDDVDTFTEHVAAARSLLAEIDDEEDRALLAADLDEMTGN